MPARPSINPSIREIWVVARNIKVALGFNTGMFLYTASVFLYQHFGSNAYALRLTIILMITVNILRLALEVPTGVIADFFGRKKAIIIAFIHDSIAYFFIAWIFFTPSIKISFILALLGNVFGMIYYTLMSGSFTAWIVDSVRERGVSEGHGPILARISSLTFISQLAGAVVGLSLYLAGMIYLAYFLAFSIMVFLTFYCSFLMKETKSLDFHKGPVSFGLAYKKMKETLQNGFSISVKTPALICLIMVQVSFMFLTNVVSSLWPIAMLANFGAGKMSPFWFLAAFLCKFSAFGGSKSLEFSSKPHLRSLADRPSNVTLWVRHSLMAAAVGIGVIGLGYSKIYNTMTLPFFIFILAFSQFGLGYINPSYNTLLNNYIPLQHSKERATIMSFCSMLIGLVLSILLIPASGPSGSETAIGWMLPGIILIVMILVSNFIMRRYQRKIGEIFTPTMASLSTVSKRSAHEEI